MSKVLGVHLEMSDESKTYKLYDLVEKKIIVNINVFESLKWWNWGKQHLKKTSLSTNNADSDESNGEDVNEIDEANETLV